MSKSYPPIQSISTYFVNKDINQDVDQKDVDILNKLLDDNDSIYRLKLSIKDQRKSVTTIDIDGDDVEPNCDLAPITITEMFDYVNNTIEDEQSCW